MLKQNLISLLNKAKISLSEKQIDLLVAYVELLNKWNKAYNLTSVRDPNEMLIKHIMDSLVISPHLQGTSFIDVGTGPGLPGIPLAIVNPEKQFDLVDSLGKRISFLKQVKYDLNISNVFPVQSRIESYNQKQFDGVISRAFASLADMLNWCHHLPNKNGIFYALKGAYHQDEVDHLPNDFVILDTIKLTVPNLDGERYLIKIKSIKFDTE